MVLRPNARTRALKALAEGARPSIELLADAAGRTHASVRRQATREDWRMDEAPDFDFHERMLPLVNKLIGRFEALCTRAEQEGTIDRKELEEISALQKTLEKFREYDTRPQEAAKKNQRRRDEDLAAGTRQNQRPHYRARNGTRSSDARGKQSATPGRTWRRNSGLSSPGSSNTRSTRISRSSTNGWCWAGAAPARRGWVRNG